MNNSSGVEEFQTINVFQIDIDCVNGKPTLVQKNFQIINLE